MSKRAYTSLREHEWDEAAAMHSRGSPYEEIAEHFGVSVRAVSTHVPKAHERRKAAISASADGTAATAPVPSIAVAALPPVSDRKGAAIVWRQAAWADTMALQAKVRAALAEPEPDSRKIRALAAGAEALKSLIRTGRDVLDIDRHAADEVIPELVIRELLPEEVAAIREAQRQPTDLDAADLAGLREVSEQERDLVAEEIIEES